MSIHTTARISFILEKAVEAVASKSKVLKMFGFFEFFRESSSHHYGERKNSKKPSRFSAFGLRSRLQLLFLGLFTVDCTPQPRVFSPRLEDRSYVYAPNTVCGNKPITLGHKYSIAAYLPEKTGTNTPWLIPLACTRVDTAKQPTQVQNDFERIIRMIGTPAQPPKPRKKALGRQSGDIQVKRMRHPIVKKWKNTTLDEKIIA